MANDYLVKKWKRIFHLNDVDKDNLVTLKDADMFAERFSTAHEFGEEKAKQIKEMAHILWKRYILVGAEEQVTEAEYIQNLTEKFNANPEELHKELIESMHAFAEITDINKDGLISTEELYRVFDAWGAKKILDGSFIARFPQVKPGFIKIEDYSRSWIEHMINTDETVANPVSDGLQALSDAGILP